MAYGSLRGTLLDPIAGKLPRPISVGHGAEFDFDLRSGCTLRGELQRRLRRAGVLTASEARRSSLSRLLRIYQTWMQAA